MPSNTLTGVLPTQLGQLKKAEKFMVYSNRCVFLGFRFGLGGVEWVGSGLGVGVEIEDRNCNRFVYRTLLSTGIKVLYAPSHALSSTPRSLQVHWCPADRAWQYDGSDFELLPQQQLALVHHTDRVREDSADTDRPFQTSIKPGTMPGGGA